GRAARSSPARPRSREPWTSAAAALLRCPSDPPMRAFNVAGQRPSASITAQWLASSHSASQPRSTPHRCGVLSNAAAADILASLDRGRLRHLVAAHLSQENNQPELARAALAAVLGCAQEEVGVASQDDGFDWLSLS
ncbi:hypothetical protein PPH41_45250, partial [Burkholderia gladioli]|nr:hypothetical protein [Burkholderia gladioli]